MEKCTCKENAFWIDGECWECGNKLSEKQFKEIVDDIKMEELQRKRNILNRKISTLKKANLEPKPNLNKEGEETELASCCFCGELFDSTGTGDSDCGNCH